MPPQYSRVQRLIARSIYPGIDLLDAQFEASLDPPTAADALELLTLAGVSGEVADNVLTVFGVQRGDNAALLFDRLGLASSILLELSRAFVEIEKGRAW